MTVRNILPLTLPLFALLVILLIVSPPGAGKEKLGGICISGGLWILGYGLLRWAEKQNPRILLGLLIGGMLFRIAFVILSIYFVRKFTDWETMRFVVSLLIFYFACEFALVMGYALRKG